MNQVPQTETARKLPRMHYGWVVVAVTFLTLLVSAGVRSMPSIFMLSFEKDFGWSRGGISSVVSIGIFLYGLVGPFSASFLERFGVRRVMLFSIALLAAGLAVTPLMNALWQFEILWGVITGIATGFMANVLGVTVSNKWFAQRRGLVVGILTASAATGQLLFLPLLARITVESGWKSAVYTAVAVLVGLLLIVAVFMRNHPSDVGVAPYGSTEVVQPTPFRGNLFLAPLLALRSALRSKSFWLLAGTFFFCGYSTNGLIGTHLIPACGDFGITEVTAASLLALMGLFDLFGTTLSGWLSDRFDSRWLLAWYYGLRGLSLLFLPYALSAGPTELLLFSVFYGLDWIATVPPTVKLATQEFGKERSGMIFGWVVVAHQLGASTAAYGAGALRDWLGTYSTAFVSAGFVCLFAAVISTRIGRKKAASLS
ncbi:sugar phosphate permease [Paenibacillus cellulosilyticus]|uniref:Sugar phosphate permease n=1 Tax=Paenibacillus cellulosilyticus TaxID=375489 RepID=A0A2V2YZ57_9BACL|nr:MFS transporter [Paenibacillus cellulosilyticus]PWW05144.1 sugar phosphate permease [Paenibacillus cellulosilyticus]QKS48934.1 MFS transporter [Paenibacillus cellulosilyticus]